MPLGFQPSRDSLNQRVGQIAASSARLFEDINQLVTWAAQNTDANLVTLGMTAGEITEFRTFVADATNWRDTTYGQRPQAQATNFMFNILKARAYI
ncbi:hypothetical protein [Microbacterium sp. CJ88]|uniref:hypothetical protein n=1 Tax=Microbacterium sp. CJ88 TaxID=3445672 RepID=UPI003F65ADB6